LSEAYWRFCPFRDRGRVGHPMSRRREWYDRLSRSPGRNMGIGMKMRRPSTVEGCFQLSQRDEAELTLTA
jgi:hypothetical protein